MSLVVRLTILSGFIVYSLPGFAQQDCQTSVSAAAGVPYPMIAPLAQARRQCIGNCGYQAHLRAIEYLYQAVHKKPIRLSVNTFSAAAAIEKAKRAIYHLEIPLEAINASSGGMPSQYPFQEEDPGVIDYARVYNSDVEAHYGLRPERCGISAKTRNLIVEEARELVRHFRNDSEAIDAHYAFALGSTKRVIWDVQRNDDQAALERTLTESLDYLARRYGLAKDSAFRFRGESFTNESFQRHVSGNIHWVPLLWKGAERHGLKNGYQPDLPQCEVRSYTEIESCIAPPSTLNHKVPVVVSQDDFYRVLQQIFGRDFPIVVHVRNFQLGVLSANRRFEYPREADMGVLVGAEHAMVGVGLERTPFDDGPVIVHQNSHGPTYSKEGLLPYPVESFVRGATHLLIPVVLSTPSSQLTQ